jgi:eukaryotic-like serine/threonine-protein kinase
MKQSGPPEHPSVTPTFSWGASVGKGAPSRIGPYRIIRTLGEGGMGAVFLAEQTEPVQREVAIKILKLVFVSDMATARFEAERQALAVMEHPNITKVFDAGITDTGLPYFVMERVSGVPLTEYADAHKLGVSDRIRLFIQICRAVQHAHQKGLIHRDLKPSNVLVSEMDGEPVCKVIDFGIAKATESGDRAALTQTGVAIGTPAYMSPEQWTGSGLDIDTRSDIYSLGIMLYELLIGVLPVDPEEYRGVALLAQYTHADVKAPSARFAALKVDEQTRIATLRGTDAASLRRSIQGDLNWITLKALYTERARRYDSANAFADDLERHLSDRPVMAGPPSGAYVMRKFVRRHRGAVAFAATVVLLLVGFSVAVTVQARRIAAARTVAERRQGQAEELIGFMLGDLRTRLQTVGRLDVLDQVGKKSEDYFAAVPESELSAAELFRRSQALRQLGEVRVDQGDFAAAMRAFQQSLSLAEPLARRDPLNGEWQLGLGASHFWVGFIHWRRNELDSALAQFLPYLRITEALVTRAPDSLTYRNELGQATNNIGSVKEAQGDLAGALESFRAAIAAKQTLVRRDSTKLDWQLGLANSYNAAGSIQRKLGDLDGAERTHRAELAVKERLVARDTANRQYQLYLALAHNFLGDLLLTKGDVPQGSAHLGTSRDLYAALAARDTSNPDRRRLLANANRLMGVVAIERGEPATALREFRSSRASIEPLVARTPANRVWQNGLARTLTNLGSALAGTGRFAEAELAERRALSILEPALQQRPGDQTLRSYVADAYLTLGDVLSLKREPGRARAAWTQSLATIDSLARASQLTDHLALRAWALLRLDRIDEARPVVEELLRRGYRRPRWLALVREKMSNNPPKEL